MKKLLTLIQMLVFGITYSQCNIQMNPNSCSGTDAYINITSGEIYDSYQWYYKPIGSSANFQMIAGATNPSLICDWTTYNQNYIKVQCFYNNGIDYFSNTIELDIANCSLTTPKENFLHLSLFPNPSTEFFTINSSNTLDEINIFNSLGQKVLVLKDSTFSKIDVSFLKSGVYFLKALSGNNSKQISFIKI